jgi:hypothetical protein
MVAKRPDIDNCDEGEEDVIHDLQVQPRCGLHRHRRILVDSITGFNNFLFEACLVEAMFHLGIPRCFYERFRYKQLLRQTAWRRPE